MLSLFRRKARSDTYWQGLPQSTVAEKDNNALGLNRALVVPIFPMEKGADSSVIRDDMVGTSIVGSPRHPSAESSQVTRCSSFSTRSVVSLARSSMASEDLLVLRSSSNPYSCNYEAATQITLLELFTSGACSASAQFEGDLLKRLAEATQKDTVLYPIAYHVDYWNEVTGWTDVFSDPKATKRQLYYQNRVSNSHNLYTPQVIVNGSQSYVGSRLLEMFATPAKSSPTWQRRASVDINVKLCQYQDDSVVVEPTASCDMTTLASLDPNKLTLMIVIVDESAVSVYPTKGCNAGQRVQHVNIAASWRQLKLKNFSGQCHGFKVALEVPQGPMWGDQIAVVAFMQDRRDGAVLGFCRRTLPTAESINEL